MADYKHTLFLPKTEFPMKGNMTTREPIVVAQWREEGLYQKIRNAQKGKKKYILHWGPPYANGNIHVGHAFNGIFKDVIVRARTSLGYDAPLVPGWDCHGLPIEWKIEEAYREQGKQKENVPIDEFRQECRKFAAKWVDIQKSEFARLGILCDMENPYITMNFKAEASIAGEIFKFLKSGSLYKGVRPIMWSVVEQTALAEAEVEYQDKVSSSIYVAFPITQAPAQELTGAKVLIWTTTPWTIPANQAVCYHEDVGYVLIEIAAQKYLVAQDLLESVSKLHSESVIKTLKEFKGSDLAGIICAHPLADKGYTHTIPLLHGDHVTTESGTGFVHTAPAHGPDDFALGKKYNLDIVDVVRDDGVFVSTVPLFAGQHIFKADALVIDAIADSGNLFHKTKLTHSYPHSWRSKAPLIFRTTPQWFISLDKNGLREKALKAIKKTKWFPKQGENRISAMVEDRPDWCISRQRTWGVPLPFFMHKETQEVLMDDRINDRILRVFQEEGCDAWFSKPAAFFLDGLYDPEDYTQIKDIVDVWFESGASQGFVLEDREELQRPADAYVEGSDQHRGWFMSSLLVGCGTRDEAPFKSVVTHGFTVDEQGRKMSKSLGNTVAPQQVMDEMGAEILRLWTISCDYTDDLRIGKEILKYQQDIYRRYRNTLRYLLGALDQYNGDSKTSYESLPILEKWVLHRLYELQQLYVNAVENYSFQAFYHQLHSFCSSDLSAFYFDIRKDTLYCDGLDSPKRQANLYVMDQIFKHLVLWLNPVLSFTSQEAWEHRYPGQGLSVHFQELPEMPDLWSNKNACDLMEKARSVRRVITTTLEEARSKGVIGSSLQAQVIVYDPKSDMDPQVDFVEFCIISQMKVLKENNPEGPEGLLSCTVVKAEDAKCERCWKVLPEVGKQEASNDLCHRCSGEVAAFEKTA